MQESKEKQESELQHVRQRITYQNNKYVYDVYNLGQNLIFNLLIKKHKYHIIYIFYFRIQELEENLDTARKDLIKSEDSNNRLQKENQEVYLLCLPLTVFKL